MIVQTMSSYLSMNGTCCLPRHMLTCSHGSEFYNKEQTDRPGTAEGHTTHHESGLRTEFFMELSV